MIATALSIAGSDPSGGAGIQADLKVFHQFSVYGTSVTTLLTVQNTLGIQSVNVLTPDLVRAQLKAVLDDIPPKAIKTGALGSAEIIDCLIGIASTFNCPFIIDPIIKSSSKVNLLDGDGLELLKHKLLRFAYVVTPNISEAEVLSERNIDSVMAMERAAKTIALLGPKHVVVTGGHLENESSDVVFSKGQLYRLPAAKLQTSNTHGSGCVFSAAITARLAYKEDVLKSVEIAKKYVTEAIRTSPHLGLGNGPLNLHANINH